MIEFSGSTGRSAGAICGCSTSTPRQLHEPFERAEARPVNQVVRTDEAIRKRAEMVIVHFVI